MLRIIVRSVRRLRWVVPVLLLSAAPALAQGSNEDPLPSEAEIHGEPSRKLTATIESVTAESLRIEATSRRFLLLAQNTATTQRNGPSIGGIVASAAIIATGAYFYERGSRNRNISYLSGPPWVECGSEPPTKPRPPNWDQYPNTGSTCGRGDRILGTTLIVVGGLVLAGSLF